MNFVDTEWRLTLSKLLKSTLISKPRDMLIKELLCHTTTINMNFPIIQNPLRNLNYKFMFGEAWWILIGSNRVSEITQFMKAIKKFSDNGLTFDGAYGPMVVDQLRYVVDTLTNDLDSRQAIISIWRPNPRPSKDIPCTLTLQFIIRNGKLNCIANMRSSDIWLGWVYDVFNFSMISAYIALEVRNNLGKKIELGDLYINAGSQHIYENNFRAGKAILENDIDFSYPCNSFNLNYFNDGEDLIRFLFHHAKKGEPNFIY